MASPLDVVVPTVSLSILALCLDVVCHALHSEDEVTRSPYIYQHLGLEYDEKVLPSIGNEVLKAVVAQFNAVEQKQAAQFKAERSKFVVMKADQERRAAVIRAEGHEDVLNFLEWVLQVVGIK
ncbi:Prohibitin-3, mitochondrial, partial [Linum perenne]